MHGCSWIPRPGPGEGRFPRGRWGCWVGGKALACDRAVPHPRHSRQERHHGVRTAEDPVAFLWPWVPVRRDGPLSRLGWCQRLSGGGPGPSTKRVSQSQMSSLAGLRDSVQGSRPKTLAHIHSDHMTVAPPPGGGGPLLVATVSCRESRPSVRPAQALGSRLCGVPKGPPGRGLRTPGRQASEGCGRVPSRGWARGPRGTTELGAG